MSVARTLWHWWQQAVVARRVRPEVVAKLEEGFSKRIERRRRQHAARLKQAEGTLAAEHLGALVGVFHLRMGRSRPQGRHDWVYAGEEGLIQVLEHAGPPAAEVMRWDDVISIYRLWGAHYHPGISEDEPYVLPAGHRLVRRSGQDVELAVEYANVLDPYRNVGRFVAAAMPANAGATLPRFPTLGELAEQALTRQLLPAARANYERGQRLSFGPLGLDRQGVHMADDDALLAWQELESIATSGPLMAVGKRGSRDAWRMLDITAVPNVCVLNALLETISGQS
jgi:hypothetical protein